MRGRALLLPSGTPAPETSDPAPAPSEAHDPVPATVAPAAPAVDEVKP
jgi:hypothetical protein